MNRTKFLSGILIALAAILIVTGLHFSASSKQRHKKIELENISCIFDLTKGDDTTDLLLAGYNYALLKQFASDKGIEIDIRNSAKGYNIVDSLVAGTIQFGVLPFGRQPEIPDSLLISFTLDSASLWVMKSGDLEKAFEAWVWAYFNSGQNDSLRQIYTEYNPIFKARNGEKMAYLGPYDDLIKANAQDLGWDWRLLAAAIFQESHFRLASRSSKGAEGLMQVIPATASRYDADNILDPEVNIQTGTKHLKRMTRLFRQRAANQEELRKIALGAYNAGEGHIIDCIHYAEEKNLEYNTWDDLVNVIYTMELDSELDSLQYPRFKSSETITYVKRIYDYYWAFCKIYDPNAMQSEPSEQDQP